MFYLNVLPGLHDFGKAVWFSALASVPYYNTFYLFFYLSQPWEFIGLRFLNLFVRSISFIILPLPSCNLETILAIIIENFKPNRGFSTLPLKFTIHADRPSNHCASKSSLLIRLKRCALDKFISVCLFCLGYTNWDSTNETRISGRHNRRNFAYKVSVESSWVECEQRSIWAGEL